MPRRPDHRITIRFTPEEYALITVKAGTEPLASFIRTQALERARSARKARTPAPVKDHTALAQVLAKLGSCAHVQDIRATAAARETGIVSTDTEIDACLYVAAADIAEIKRLLMRALGVAER